MVFKCVKWVVYGIFMGFTSLVSTFFEVAYSLAFCFACNVLSSFAQRLLEALPRINTFIKNAGLPNELVEQQLGKKGTHAMCRFLRTDRTQV